MSNDFAISRSNRKCNNRIDIFLLNKTMKMNNIVNKTKISIENTFVRKTKVNFSNTNIKCFNEWYEWQYVELSYSWIFINSWLLQLRSHWWWKLSNKCFADVHMLLRKMTICHKFCNEAKWSYSNSTSGKLLIINQQLLHEVEFQLFHLYGLQNLWCSTEISILYIWRHLIGTYHLPNF
jgi:hypothetical protein